MKKIQTYLLLSFIAGILYGCVTKVQTTSVIPCSVEEDSSSQYIRRVGHGACANLQMARNESLIDAKIKILYHLLNTPLSIDSIVFLQTDILPFEKECEKVFFNENQYHVYTRLACQIPDEEKLVYYRERFRKYAEEKQKQMMEKQRNSIEGNSSERQNQHESFQYDQDNSISPKNDNQ